MIPHCFCFCRQPQLSFSWPFLRRFPLSFSGGLCFLVRTAPILQQALQFLSLEPSAQAALANSSGLCVYLEQLAKPWCLTGQTNQVPSGTTSKQDMPKTGIPMCMTCFPIPFFFLGFSTIIPWLGIPGLSLTCIQHRTDVSDADAGTADDDGDGWKHPLNTPHFTDPVPNQLVAFQHQTWTNQAKCWLKQFALCLQSS